MTAVVVLAILLVAVFLPLDGVDAQGGGGGGGAGGGGDVKLKCYDCKATKDDDSGNCRRPIPRTKTCNNGVSCLKSKTTGGGANSILRECSLHKIVEDCKTGLIIDNEETVTCACHKDRCNSAQYLHGTPLFVIGLILFTVVWKII